MTECAACGSGVWHVKQFTGGEGSAVERRKCQNCGHEWTEALEP